MKTSQAHEHEPATRFKPMPAEVLDGRFEHFATEQQKKEHEDWIKQHASQSPF